MLLWCWQAGTPQISAAAEQPAKGAAGVKAPLVYAHRGGRKWAPENTLSAFRKSLEAHADGIELDIHRLKSGELVVMHDESVDRTTNGTGLIKDMTYRELKKLSAGTWFSPQFKKEKVPLLSDVLALVDGKMIINIEIKNAPVAYPGIDEDLAKLLSTYKYPDKIVVSSFDHEVLRRLHKKAPQYKLALLIEGILVDIGEYAAGVGATQWNPAFSEIRGDSVEDAHKASLQINVWTVNKPAAWQEAVNMGVDGIITDDPKGLIDYLQSHP